MWLRHCCHEKMDTYRCSSRCLSLLLRLSPNCNSQLGHPIIRGSCLGCGTLISTRVMVGNWRNIPGESPRPCVIWMLYDMVLFFSLLPLTASFTAIEKEKEKDS